MNEIIDKLIKLEKHVKNVYTEYQDIKRKEGVINAHLFSEKHQLDKLLSVRSNIEKYINDMMNLIDDKRDEQACTSSNNLEQ